MNVKELEKAQKEITDAIYARAVELGFDEKTMQPITDGVCDFEGYLNSIPKLMWILKEPNDQCPDGKLAGGGWSIVEESFKNDIEGVGKIPSWQPIIYVMYGYQHNQMYEDMEYIHDNKDMAKEMQRIAYLNVSKMQGYNTSSKVGIEQCYHQW